MVTITVHPEHVDGLAELVDREFEAACEEKNVDRARAAIAFGDVLDCWPGGRCSIGEEPREVRLSGILLDTLIDQAWSYGNEAMSNVYCHRGEGGGVLLCDVDQYETEARSMLAFHEHMQGQAVVA